MTIGYGLNDEMLETMRINFHTLEGNKNGSPKEHKFRILPAYAPNKLFHKVGLHWGYKTVDGKIKALTCSLEESGTCPICDKVKQVEGMIQNIDAALITEFDPHKRDELTSAKTQYEEFIKNNKRKPMYLWNVVLETGEQKVLQLSWNGHDPLFEKIKYIFKNMRVDVTSLTNSILMYCNRSGLKAKTRYQYEMIQNTEKDLSQEITKLTDLSKVYLNRGVKYLQKIVETEIVPNDNTEDVSERDFDAKQEQNYVPNNIQNPIDQKNQEQQNTVYQQTQINGQTQNKQETHTHQMNVSENRPVTNNVQTSSQIELTDEQDKNVQEMMKALRG